MRRLRKVPYIYILKLFHSDWDCSRTLFTDAEDYVRVANSEGKNQLSFTSDRSIFANCILFFLAAFKNWPSFTSKAIDCHLYLITYDVRNPLIIGECDVKLGDYLVGNALFSNYSHYKRQSCIITLKERFPCFPLAFCVNFII